MSTRWRCLGVTLAATIGLWQGGCSRTAPAQPDLLVFTVAARNTSDTTAWLTDRVDWPELRPSADLASSPVFPGPGAPKRPLDLLIQQVMPHDGATTG